MLQLFNTSLNVRLPSQLSQSETSSDQPPPIRDQYSQSDDQTVRADNTKKILFCLAIKIL